MRKYEQRIIPLNPPMILMALLFLILGSMSARAEDQKPREIKVCILTMFEVGAVSGDFPGELQHWYEGFFTKAQHYHVEGLPQIFYCNDQGVGGALMGIGKAQAASSLTALLKDPRFDFSHAYFLVSGCAGGPPGVTTLGSVFVCDGVVDYELGHSWKESDGVSGEIPFMMMEDLAEQGYIPLNKDLALWALNAAKNTSLEDSRGARTYRKLYDQYEEAPSIQSGVSVTADSYWHGSKSSKTAEHICHLYNAGHYGITQMEDSAFALVLRNFGYLSRLLIVRDVVNFDQPHQGQTIKESLGASSGGFSIGMTNGYNVGSVLVNLIIDNWEERKEKIVP